MLKSFLIGTRSVLTKSAAVGMLFGLIAFNMVYWVAQRLMFRLLRKKQ